MKTQLLRFVFTLWGGIIISAVFQPQQLLAQDLKKGLLVHYPFDDGAVDVSSTKLNGQVKGATLKEGRCGFKSYFFNGETDYIECGNSPVFNNLKGLTVSAWVHPNHYSFRGLVMLAGKWGFDNKNDQFALFLNSSKQIVFAVAGPGVNEAGVKSRFFVPQDEWTHVVATWDISGKISIYINGKPNNRGSQTGRGYNNTSKFSFKIGRQVTGKSRAFPGYLDEIRVYNRSLSESEVAALNTMDLKACNKVVFDGDVLNRKTKKAVNDCDVVFEDLNTGKEVLRIKTQAGTNHFRTELPIGPEYAFYAQKDGFLSLNENVDTKNLPPYSLIRRNLYLIPLEVGEKLRLNNIFFDTNKASLRKRSHYELNRLIKFLQQNGSVKIEVAGHTDSRGSDTYNQSLSQRRAESVRAYLVSKGIAGDRVVAKGYGETSPVATNSTEEGMQLNRRVEVVITAK